MRIQLWPKVLFVVFVLTLLVPVNYPGADQVGYVYDSSGRLYRVIENGSVASYNYDAAGNLISIERATADSLTPLITGISPGQGYSDSSIDVTISGSNLSGVSLVVDKPGISVSNVRTAESAVTAKFNISSQASNGTANITLINAIGSAQTVFTVTIKPPFIRNIAPNDGPVTRRVEITGTGFSTNSSENTVLFNGVAAPVYHSSYSEILTAVPDGATTGPLTVVREGAQPSNPMTFRVSEQGPPPTISSISPDSGSVEGGSIVLIAGSGFTADTQVSIESSTVVISPNLLQVRIAPHREGKCDVFVSNINGDAFVPEGFTYIHGAALKVVNHSPSFASANVPVNSPVSALFSRPVNTGTVDSGSFSLIESGSGTSVAGTFSFDCGNTAVIFKPTAPLKPGTIYQVSITSNLKSTGGIPLNQELSGSFTTGSSSDESSPTVTINPGNGNSGLPVNAVIQFAFSEPVSPILINSSTITVTNDGIAVPGELRLSQDNKVAAFISSSLYQPNSSVNVVLSGKVTDVAGNPVVGSTGVGTDLVSSFTTGKTKDVVSPRVLSVDPPAGATGVNTSALVSVTFSEPINTAIMNTESFVLSIWGSAFPCNISFSTNNTVATLIPEIPLPLSSDIVVTLKGITDMTGNVMPAYGTGFKTQANADTSPPQVIGINPYSQQTNTPINSPARIAFNEPVYSLTVNSSNFYLLDSAWKVVPGSVSLSADGRLAVFTPANQLLPNTYYQLRYKDIRDTAGNALVNQGSFSFQTGSDPDSGHPEVKGTSPANGAKSVPINSEIVVLFNEDIDETSVNGNTFIVSKNGIPIEGSRSFDESGDHKIVRYGIADSGIFAPNSFYQVTVTTGITDTAGNSLSREWVTGFTTGDAEDTAPPTLTGVSPFDYQSDVPVNAPIRISFNEPVQPPGKSSLTVTALVDGWYRQVVQGTLSLSGDGRVATFTPVEPLLPSTPFDVNYGTGIRDMAGNHLGSEGSTRFWTGEATDTIPPRLIAVSPADGSQGMPTNSRVSFRFSEAIDATSVNGRTILVSKDGVPVSGNLSYDLNQKIVVFQAADPGFLPSTRYDAKVIAGVRDTAGNTLEQGSAFGFTTGLNADLTPLNVTGTSPGDGQKDVPTNSVITIVFDKPFDPLTVNEDSLGLGSDTSIPTVMSISPDNRSVTLSPTEELPANTYCTVSYNDVIRDMAGNSLSNPGWFTFSTGTGPDSTPPQVLETSPPNGTTDVPTNFVVLIRFSDAVAETTVNNSTIVISRNGTPVNGNFSFGQTGDTKIVRFQPAESGLPGTSYEVKVAKGVTNLAGKPLALEYSAGFTTGSAEDTEAPGIVSVSPADGATDMSVFAPVEVVFTEPIDPVTVNESTFQLVVEDFWPVVFNRRTMIAGVEIPSGFTFPGAYTISPDGRKATFTPAYPLLAGRLDYSLKLNGIEDLAGNPLSETTFHFATAMAAGTDPSTLPFRAAVFLDSYSLNPDGSSTTGIQIIDIMDESMAAVPDGTKVAVTTEALYGPKSGGGSILEGTELSAHPGFKITTVTGGTISLTYKAPNLPNLPATDQVRIYVQAFSVDADGNPVDLLGYNSLILSW